MKLRISLRRFGGYLGLERNVLVMTAGRALNGFGGGLWREFVPKVLQGLGATAPMIGVFGTVNSAVTTLFSYLGGALSDRMGRGRAMVFAFWLSVAGYGFYLVAPTWWLFLPGSVLLSATAYLTFMGSMALVGEAVEGKRRAVSMASQSLIVLPLSLAAPPLGGLLIARLGIVGGFRTALAITIVLTTVGIWVQKRQYRLPPPAAKRLALDLRAAWRAMQTPLRSMLVANCLMSLGSSMSTLFIVLYAMNVLGVSAVHFGLLQSVLIASSSILSIPMTKVADRRSGLGRKPYVAMAFLLIAVYPFLVVIAPSGVWLLPIFILRGIREIFDTVRKAMIIDLAGEGERGRVIGFYFFVVGLVSLPGALIAGLLWQVKPTLPFIVGGSIGMIGFVVFLFVHPSDHSGAVPHPEPDASHVDEKDD